MTQKINLHTIDLEGSPEDLGNAHGESFKTSIKEIAEIRWSLVRNFLKKMSSQEIQDLALRHVEKLKQWPEFYREFAALSEASGVSHEKLMILNNYTDIRDFTHGDEGCSSVAMLKPNGEMVVGQTWDMHASAAPYILKMNITNSRGEKSQVLSITGCLGLAGVGQHSVAVLINNMHSKETQDGLMWPALVRGMLGQKSARLALHYLNKNMPCSGHNYLLADQTEFINVEATGQRTQITAESKQPGTFSFHTNHYVGSLVESEILHRRSSSTVRRWNELNSYFSSSQQWEQLGHIELCDQIFSGKNTPAVCVRADVNDPHSSMTCGGLAVNLSQRTGVAFAGLYQEGSTHPFTF